MQKEWHLIPDLILQVRINSYSSGLLSRRELTAQCARLTNEQKVGSWMIIIINRRFKS